MTGDAPSFEQLERTIGSVAGVAAAQVVRGERGGGRLRIRLEPGEDAGRVAWSVAATLRERFGIALDPEDIRPLVRSEASEHEPEGEPDHEPEREPEHEHEHEAAREPQEARGVSDPHPGQGEPTATSVDLAEAVAAALHDLATRELDDSDEEGDPTSRHAILTPPAPGQSVAPDHPGTEPPRAIIQDLLVTHARDQVEVTAILALGTRQATGEATGPAGSHGALRASAEATLEALSALTGGLLHAGIDHVTVSPGEDVEAATVVLTVLSEERAEELLGAALLRGEPELAVMRATLDALNRRISLWLLDAAEDGPA